MASTSERSWRVRRLLAMSPAEVALRVARGIAARRSRPDRPRPQEEIVSPESVLAEMSAAGSVSDRVERELRAGVGRVLPGARDAAALESAMRELGVEPETVVAAGGRVLAGEIPAFGWTMIPVGEEPDWHRDPVTGRPWPLEYWADIDYRDARDLGDPRYVWEVNRHHHLVTLARAWMLSGDDRYAERVWQDIVSWIGLNPPLFGINWASPLEIAIRLISWSLALDIVGSTGAKEGDAAALATSVSLQARHLSDNLSVYASSRNNHLIGEAAGLLVTGAKFPFLRGSLRVAALGQRLVERELGAQVSADGVTREQAFQYQTFVMEFALLSAVGAACMGTSLAPEVQRTVGLMARFLDRVRCGAGVPPSVGDEDGGRAYELADGHGRQAAMAIAAASLYSRRDDVAPRASNELEPALWLFGPALVSERLRSPWADTDRGAADSDPGEPSAFEQGGYFLASRGDQHGVIDCGPLGYLSIAAHGHADCLSLSVAHGGDWILVDPGTFCYHRDELWRDHFRSTLAHNTVSVDGASQSEMLGPFMWGRRARSTQLVWARGEVFDYFEGAHDGYVRPSGTRHHRSVLLVSPGYWVIVDSLDGRGEHRVTSTFQLARGFRRVGEERGRGASGATTRLERGDTVAEFTTWCPDGMEVVVAEGEESPPRGWVSTGFDRKTPAPSLIVEGSVKLPATLVTALALRTGEREIEFTRTAEGRGGRRGVVLEVAHGQRRDTVFVGEPDPASQGDRFTGILGLITRSGGEEKAWGLGIREWTVGGSRVRHEPIVNRLFRGRTDGARP